MPPEPMRDHNSQARSLHCAASLQNTCSLAKDLAVADRLGEKLDSLVTWKDRKDYEQDREAKEKARSEAGWVLPSIRTIVSFVLLAALGGFGVWKYSQSTYAKTSPIRVLVLDPTLKPIPDVEIFAAFSYCRSKTNAEGRAVFELPGHLDESAIECEKSGYISADSNAEKLHQRFAADRLFILRLQTDRERLEAEK